MADLGRLARRVWRGYVPRTYLGVWLSAVWMGSIMLVLLALFDPTGGWAVHIFFGLVMAVWAFSRGARGLNRRRTTHGPDTGGQHFV
jgi:uncharacterized membrane protein